MAYLTTFAQQTYLKSLTFFELCQLRRGLYMTPYSCLLHDLGWDTLEIKGNYEKVVGTLPAYIYLIYD